MREIKFRARYKHLASGKDLWQESTVDYRVSTKGYKRITDWQQFTGLKDCNDLDIYEGDICTFIVPMSLYAGDAPKDGWIGEVMWDMEDAGFFIMSYTDVWRHIPIYYARNIKVIGNIYENPELMED